jgi:hypothetical protein
VTGQLEDFETGREKNSFRESFAHECRDTVAAEYRRSYQYMSFKGWTRGEPSEPVFQGPELLQTAFDALGNKVDLTADRLCADLSFTHKTFEEVTGLHIPSPAPKLAEVLPMRIA